MNRHSALLYESDESWKKDLRIGISSVTPTYRLPLSMWFTSRATIVPGAGASMEMMIPEAATTLAALSTPASCAGSAVGWADADPWRELPSVAVADRGRGTPKHSIVKQDAAGHDMITVGTRPTNVAPDHELSLVRDRASTLDGRFLRRS